MGFGKFLLGGVCAVGAVIAAPVVVPAAGLALATGTMAGTGAASLAAFNVGMGMYVASSATVATVAGVTAGAAGLAAGSAQEKKVDEAYENGRRSGFEDAAVIFEQKYRKQYEAFMKKEKDYKKDKEEYESLIKGFEGCIHDLQIELSKKEENETELRKQLRDREMELSKLRELSKVS